MKSLPAKVLGLKPAHPLVVLACVAIATTAPACIGDRDRDVLLAPNDSAELDDGVYEVDGNIELPDVTTETTPDVTTETTPDVTTETTPDTLPDVVPECTVTADCDTLLAPGACERTTCVNGTCALANAEAGTSCDDDDPCTIGDSCSAGACVGGSGILQCAPVAASDPCFVAACIPLRGCGTVPVAAGKACDNGSGPTPGSCQLGGYVAADQCDGQGACLDTTLQLGDPTAPTLDGAWFAVHTTFGRSIALSTARAVLDVTDTNRFVVKAARERGFTPFTDDDSGYFCTKASGAIDGSLAGGRVSGTQVDERLAVVADSSGDGLTTMLRADLGSTSQVDGRYAYFQTSIVFNTTTPTTWRGTVDFNSGCLATGSIATDPSVSVSYFFAANSCLTAATPHVAERNLYTLLTGVRATEGDTQIYPIKYRGAIGPGGDVLLLVKEDFATESTPEYGIVILVRQPANAPALDPSALAGDWSYHLHAKIAGDLPRRDTGFLTWDAQTALTGGPLTTLDGARTVNSGWHFLDAAAHTMSQRVSIPGLDLYQSGVVDPSGRFIVGWTVRTPDANGAALLDTRPRYGSMLLMLRP